MNDSLGSKIRNFRKEKSITLVELSEKSGVAQATLSRIETGIMTGTVESHQRIARALGLNLAELYAGIDERVQSIVLQEPFQRSPVTLHTQKARCELLTTQASAKKITPLLITLDPQGEIPEQKLEAGVEKFFFVLDGEVLAVINQQEYTLKSGETIYFEGSLPHRLVNLSPQISKVFCAVSPAAL